MRLPRFTRRQIVLAAVAGVLLAGGAAAGFLIALHRHRVNVEARLTRYGPLIERHAAEAGVPADLVRAVVRAESGGDPRAVSPAGARGLMQIRTPAEQDVLRRLRTEPGDLFDPDYNLRIGTRYLAMCLTRFDGDCYLALAAYNRGPTWVADVRRAHPDLTGRQLVEQFAPSETRAYCARILAGRPERIDPPAPATRNR